MIYKNFNIACYIAPHKNLALSDCCPNLKLTVVKGMHVSSLYPKYEVN